MQKRLHKSFGPILYDVATSSIFDDEIRSFLLSSLPPRNLDNQLVRCNHGLRTPREEIAFTARPKIQSQSQIFRYGRSIFCLPHRPNFSDIFDLCLHWVSVVRENCYSNQYGDLNRKQKALINPPISSWLSNSSHKQTQLNQVVFSQ